MGVLIGLVAGAAQRQARSAFRDLGAGQQPRLLYTGLCRLSGHERRTFGFDWCYGDDELLKFVGREGLP